MNTDQSRNKLRRAAFLAPDIVVGGLKLRPLSPAVVDLAAELGLRQFQAITGAPEVDPATPYTTRDQLRELSAIYYLMSQPIELCSEAVYSGKFFTHYLPEFTADFSISELQAIGEAIGEITAQVGAASVQVVPKGEPTTEDNAPGNS